MGNTLWSGELTVEYCYETSERRSEMYLTLTNRVKGTNKGPEPQGWIISVVSNNYIPMRVMESLPHATSSAYPYRLQMYAAL
jgi:hypothetical protein